MTSKPESATVTAARLGLSFKRGKGATTLTNDHLLDLAVAAYWRNRVARNSGRGAGEGPRPVTTTGAL